MDPVSTVDSAVPHSQDARLSSCGVMKSNANNRVYVPEAGSAESVKVRDGPSPLKAIEAAGGLGAGLLSLRGMTSLHPQGISQLNQDPIPENMKAHRVIATKKLGRFHRLPPVKKPMIYQPLLNLV